MYVGEAIVRNDVGFVDKSLNGTIFQVDVRNNEERQLMNKVCKAYKTSSLVTVCQLEMLCLGSVFAISGSSTSKVTIFSRYTGSVSLLLSRNS